MTDDFQNAMQRALEATRAGDPGGATAIIQSALGGHGTADPRPAAPAEKNVTWRHHSGSAGARDVRVFVPDGDVRGVVLMLHGCTQTPQAFAHATGMDAAANAAGFVVAYPAQTGAHNAQSCWNWFLPAHQARKGGEAQLLADLARDLGAEFDCADNIHAAGLSAGGAMAAVLGDTHPELFRAIGVHSGLAAGSAQDMPGAFAAMRGGAPGRASRVPAIVFHGTSDTTVSPRNAPGLVSGDGIELDGTGNGRSWSHLTTDGGELWMVKGAGHAWFGGTSGGSFSDPKGPNASTEMLRFFSAAGDRA